MRRTISRRTLEKTSLVRVWCWRIPAGPSPVAPDPPATLRPSPHPRHQPSLHTWGTVPEIQVLVQAVLQHYRFLQPSPSPSPLPHLFSLPSHKDAEKARPHILLSTKWWPHSWPLQPSDYMTSGGAGFQLTDALDVPIKWRSVSFM